jgi:hypothetical protein
MVVIFIGVFVANLAVFWTVMLYFSLKQEHDHGTPREAA